MVMAIVFVIFEFDLIYLGGVLGLVYVVVMVWLGYWVLFIE